MRDYKRRALLKAKQEASVVDITLCPLTDKELYFTAGSNKRYNFQSYGTCHICRDDFHTMALAGMDGVTQPPWPVCYFGYICDTCYEKDGYEASRDQESDKDESGTDDLLRGSD